MLSALLARAHATDTPAYVSITPSGVPGLIAPSTHDLGSFLDPSSPTSLTRHYTSLQDHADQLVSTESSGQDEGLTPRRHVDRREGFSWDQRSSLGNESRHSRNPMAMEQERPKTPPPLEEIIRRTTIDDADHIQNSKLQHIDSMESHASENTGRTGSFSTETNDSYVRDHRRPSIAAFAKGIARHVPEFRMLHLPESKDDQDRRDSQEAMPMKLHKKDRMLSFAPPPIVKAKESYEQGSKPSVFIEEPTTPTNNAKMPSSPQSPMGKGGLRDRRKVNLDLSMPTVIPDLPARGRSPVDIMANLGAPRARSPKTPWIRKEQPKWEPVPMAKTTPILEEDYIRDNNSALSNDNKGALGLLPDTDAIFSSQSLKFERPPPKVRDRCYIDRPRSKRARSGRSGKSGTSASDSTLAQTPDGNWTLAEEKTYREQQARTKAELQQIASESKATRSRRWLWLNKTSSEDAPPSPGPAQSLSRRFSFNLFRRSNRISDQNTAEVTKQQTPFSFFPARGKQVHPVKSLAQMHAPPAFIPPGLQRVPTPPMFDSNGEVKGKLADFFFDIHGGGAINARNKPKSSPGGYWDSDALLMSLTNDIDNPEDEGENEGPEGPPSEFINPPVDFGPSSLGGLTARTSNEVGNAAGYLGVKPPASPSLAATSPMLGHDGWYRIHQSHYPDTPDERTLAALARQEEEERRKFEWLVPEHLPSSPLCPLHPKYRGPSADLCYWHGRRSGNEIRKGEYARPGTKGAWNSASGSSGYSRDEYGFGDPGVAGGIPRLAGTPSREVKKRRLISLSNS
ncbi:hypothetical protein BKA58DRAFT_338002 [Alternaria rosae]|uniref:uncharacterized protein n=1 Tax=Alternaria rosae TaxID=1187941 RepID=UPI001E8D652B|nr:uncharacterized protein BKA58DRAFT_338002 [Alternaria rosae]KAH6873352.1 hypothetical protein BKA58DRAFT_338002 [Alternaria rosae]